jgi:hypothetical protein
MSINKTVYIENWLTILIKTYRDHPSQGLAKTIDYYLDRMINDEDIKSNKLTLCQYCSMKKFWTWQTQKIDIDQLENIDAKYTTI